MSRDGVEIELDTPNGPIVEYGPDDDIETVESEVPQGWRVSWETSAYKLTSGRFRSPLVRLPGRPARKGGTSAQLTVKVSADEETAWRAAADAAGLTLAEWIRQRCNR